MESGDFAVVILAPETTMILSPWCFSPRPRSPPTRRRCPSYLSCSFSAPTHPLCVAVVAGGRAGASVAEALASAGVHVFLLRAQPGGGKALHHR